MRRRVLTVVALLALPVAGGAAASGPADELLEAEMAFQSSARRADPKTIELRFAVAPGYYLYKKRFQVALDGRPVRPEALRLPRGQMKTDPTFGRVETFRKSVRLLISVPPTVGTHAVQLDVISQGCADSGICYPPLKQRFRLLADGALNDRPESLAGSGFAHRAPGSGSLSKSLTR
ncbi:MAG TPA: protein-disulfide reductase DsbD N-terminal domain-containing protein [Usitatibacteraceae bacterium]|nr:protein-disulfide reductase DsbD N-terminal domain-containing protein [Usitatibacteraceae bacterium]